MTLEIGIHPNVKDTIYHADRSALSSSGARLLLDVPAKFRNRMDAPQEYNPVFELGQYAHALVTNVDYKLHIVEAPDWRTKTAREERDEKKQEGFDGVLLRHEYEQVQAMREALTANPSVKELLTAQGTVAETSLVWEDPWTGVKCKARPDIATSDYTTLIDYKTTVSSNPKDFRKSVANFGYHLQAAWYLDAVKALLGVEARFLFIAQEKTAPYLVSVFELDHTSLMEGRRLSDKARQVYRDCLNTDSWPGYPEGIATISLPAWAYAHDLEGEQA